MPHSKRIPYYRKTDQISMLTGVVYHINFTPKAMSMIMRHRISSRSRISLTSFTQLKNTQMYFHQ